MFQTTFLDLSKSVIKLIFSNAAAKDRNMKDLLEAKKNMRLES